MKALRTRQDDRTAGAAVTIRRLGDGDADREALARLAERDSREAALDGPVLVAEVEGVALAAISLTGGETIADPFSRTTELRSLLELRAAQLRGRQRSARLPSRHRRARARAALAASPPGAGGRLLELPRWG
jgi:hypothetical protein